MSEQSTRLDSSQRLWQQLTFYTSYCCCCCCCCDEGTAVTYQVIIKRWWSCAEKTTDDRPGVCVCLKFTLFALNLKQVGVGFTNVDALLFEFYNVEQSHIARGCVSLKLKLKYSVICFKSKIQHFLPLKLAKIRTWDSPMLTLYN